MVIKVVENTTNRLFRLRYNLSAELTQSPDVKHSQIKYIETHPFARLCHIFSHVLPFDVKINLSKNFTAPDYAINLLFLFSYREDRGDIARTVVMATGGASGARRIPTADVTPLPPRPPRRLV